MQGSNRDTDIENRLWTQRGRGDWDRLREQCGNASSPYVKYTTSGNLQLGPGSSHLVLCDNAERWDGVGGGREIQDGGDICIPVSDSC